MATGIPYSFMRREIRRHVKKEVSEALYWRGRQRTNAIRFYAMLVGTVLALLAAGGVIALAGFWLFERITG